MSNKILFLKTIYQYVLIHWSSFVQRRPGILQPLLALNPVVFVLLLIFSTTLLTINTIFYKLLFVLFICIKIFGHALCAFQFLVCFRLTMLYFPVFNAYNFKLSSAIVRVADPIISKFEKFIPNPVTTIGGTDVSFVVSMIKYSLYFQLIGLLILLCEKTSYFFMFVELIELDDFLFYSLFISP